MKLNQVKSGLKGLFAVAAAVFGLAGSALAIEDDSVPEGYTQLTSIESTPGGGQYVDTGYLPKANTRIMAEFIPLERSSESWSVFFGAASADSSEDGVLFRYFRADEAVNAWFCNDNNNEVAADLAPGKRFAVELKANSLTLGGTEIVETNVTFETTGTPCGETIYIFSGNMGGNSWRPQAMRLFSFKIYEGSGEDPVRNFVPCIRDADGREGLYDVVCGAFHPMTLPTAYTELLCLTAQNGQYVDTGYMPNQNTRVAMDVTVQGAMEYWFGCWTNNYNKGAFCLGNDGGQGIYYGICDDGGSFKKEEGGQDGRVPNGRHTVEVTPWEFKVDGAIWATKAASSRKDFQLNLPLFLFAQNRSGSPYTNAEQGAIRCHGCRIYEGGKMVRHFIPCMDGKGRRGLYDTVEDRFHLLVNDMELPVGYVRGDYLSCYQGGYIDTGFAPTLKTRIVTELWANARSRNWGTFFGAGSERTFDGCSYDTVILRFARDTNLLNARFGNDLTYGEVTLTNFKSGVPFKVDMRAGALTIDDGSRNYYINTVTAPFNGPLYLGCANFNGTPTDPQDTKFYTFKIYDGGVLVRNFVPCYTGCDAFDSAGSVFSSKDYGARYYDTVEGVFHGKKDVPGMEKAEIYACQDRETKFMAWDENAGKLTERTINEFYIVNEYTTNLLNGAYYVVKGNVKLNHGLTVGYPKESSVDTTHLILTDGSRLEIQGQEHEAGILVKGNGKDDVLHIYGQSAGTGQLVARGGLHSAGIGGNDYKMKGWGDDCCGTVYLHGGRVEAYGGDGAAGIGGGKANDSSGWGGSVYVYGSEVTAVGANGAAGIGAASNTDKSKYEVFEIAEMAYSIRAGASAPGSYQMKYECDKAYVHLAPLEPVTYKAWVSGKIVDRTCSDYRLITPDTSELEGGWYVVEGDVTVNRGLKIKDTAIIGAAVHVILKDGANLKITASGNDAGFRVEKYVWSDQALYVYGQDAGTGKMTVTGGEGAAGIGGDGSVVRWYKSGKTVDLGYPSAGNVYIHGGEVTATGGAGGAGIGGGFGDGDGCDLYIYGGKVTANGNCGAGIGSGYWYDEDGFSRPTAGVVDIYGGVVIAKSIVEGRADLGSTSIPMSGGAGIGGSHGVDGADVSIYNGEVTAIGFNDGTIYRKVAGIGSGLKIVDKDIDPGDLYLDRAFAIWAGESEQSAQAVDTYDMKASYVKFAAAQPVTYYEWKSGKRVAKTCSEYRFITSETEVLEKGVWYVADGTVNITHGLRLGGWSFFETVGGTGRIILKDGANLTIKAGENTGDPGIHVVSLGLADDDLYIYGGEKNTGRLTVTGDGGGAGIGGSRELHPDGGNVYLYGGNVYAYGSEGGAGIGGGHGGQQGTPGGYGCEIEIFGAIGEVVAVGNHNNKGGLGIGGGNNNREYGGSIEYSDDKMTFLSGKDVDHLSIYPNPDEVPQDYRFSVRMRPAVAPVEVTNVGYVTVDGEKKTCPKAVKVEGDLATLKDDGWYVIDGNSGTLDHGLLVEDDAHLIIRRGASLAINGHHEYPGIHLKPGCSLSVYEEYFETSMTSLQGRLTVIGGENSVGIGTVDKLTEPGELRYNVNRTALWAGDNVMNCRVFPDLASVPRLNYHSLRSASLPNPETVSNLSYTKDGVTQTCKSAKRLGGDIATMKDGWYTIDGQTYQSHGIKVDGHAHLIIRNDASWTIDAKDWYAGIYVPEGSTLEIYDEGGRTGRLTVLGSGACAGIGGATAPNKPNCGTVKIHSGTVKAIGGADGGAGIGGAKGGKQGKLEVAMKYLIHEGDTENGMEICGKYAGVRRFARFEYLHSVPYMEWDSSSQQLAEKQCEKFYCIGPTTTNLEDDVWYVAVEANALDHALRLDDVAYLILTDGAKLAVTGGVDEAGICVRHGKTNSDNLYIYGQKNSTGRLTAVGRGGAGIGGDRQSKYHGGGYVSIHGGIVTAFGGSTSAGIGGFEDGQGCDNIELYGGTITATGGEIAPALGGGRGSSYQGKLTEYGSFAKFSGAAAPGVPVPEYVLRAGGGDAYARFEAGGPVSYMAWDKATKTLTERFCNKYEYVTPLTTNLVEDGWYVVTGTVTNNLGLRVTDTAHIILVDDAELTIEIPDEEGINDAGILVMYGDELSIYGQKRGTGRLNATGSGLSAGIGGNHGEGAGYGDDDCGDIWIHGGQIYASSDYCPAIGGGYDGYAEPSQGSLTLYGGTVTCFARGNQAMGRLGVYDNEELELNLERPYRLYEGTDADHVKQMTAFDYSDRSMHYMKMVPADPITYYMKANGLRVQKTCAKYRFMTASAKELEDDGWYYVEENVTVTNGLTLAGTAHLILRDGKQMTVSPCTANAAGIRVMDDDDLHIYGQAQDTGSLVANGTNGGAGIGGDGVSEPDGGEVYVHGGTVQGNGGAGGGAGIGGGLGSDNDIGYGCTVEIYGGTVKGLGGGGAQGIGGGKGAKAGYVGTIKYPTDYGIWAGGSEQAKAACETFGDAYGFAYVEVASKSGHQPQEVVDVDYVENGKTKVCQRATVIGPEVSTLGNGSWYVVQGTGSCGLNLRVAANGTANLIIRNGANYEIVSQDGRAGIFVPEGSTLNIYDGGLGTGTLTVRGNGSAAGIGGSNLGADCGIVNMFGGNVTAVGGADGGAGIGGAKGGKQGKLNLKRAFAVKAGANETSAQPWPEYDQKMCCVQLKQADPVTYLAWGASSALEERTCSDYRFVTATMTNFENNVLYVSAEKDLTVNHQLTLSGAAHLILLDGSKVTVRGGSDEAGILVSDSGDNALNIYGQKRGSGELNAFGNGLGAGIGGNGKDKQDGGKVYIYGGTVTATGGSTYGSDGGAGIGGGKTGEGCAVSLYGGTVTAQAPYACGIGGGSACPTRGTLNLYADFEIMAGANASSATKKSAYNGEFYVRLTSPQEIPPADDWPEDPSVNDGKTVEEAYEVSSGAKLAKADAGKLGAWAKECGVPFADFKNAPDAYVNPFLLNCAPGEVEKELAAFKILGISLNADGKWEISVPGANTAGKPYNGEVKVGAFRDVACTEQAAEGDKKMFFKAALEVKPVGSTPMPAVNVGNDCVIIYGNRGS